MYLRYNAEALALIDVSAADLLDFFEVNTWFFQNLFLRAQLYLAFVVVLIVGPSLLSADLRNQAMPLYLSRPLTRTGLRPRQAPRARRSGFGDHVGARAAPVRDSGVAWRDGVVGGALESGAVHGRRVGWSGRLCMSLPMLAIAAWVKWKPWARILFMGAILSGTAFGQFYKEFYDSWLGSMVVAFDVTAALSASVFGTEGNVQMPGVAAWLAAGLLVAVSAALLYRRVRAFEVVS